MERTARQAMPVHVQVHCLRTSLGASWLLCWEVSFVLSIWTLPLEASREKGGVPMNWREYGDDKGPFLGPEGSK